MELADYRFYVDWNNDGDYGESYEEVTADVQSASWSGGFNGPPPEYANAGTLTLTLRNGDGKYTQTNQSSPIYTAYGGIRPGLKVKVTMFITGGSTHNMWSGFLDLIETVNPTEPLEAGTAKLSALGILSRFAKGEVNITLQEQVTTGAALDTLLDAVDWSLTQRDLDIGRTTLYKWWVKKEQNPLDSMRQLQDAELGRLREGKDGKVVFDSRRHLFEEPGSLVSATFGIGGLEMWEPKPLNSYQYVYNSYRGNQRTFNLSDEEILATIADNQLGVGGKPPLLPAGETRTYWFELNEYSPSDYISIYEWSESAAPVTLHANTDINGNDDNGIGTSVTIDMEGPGVLTEPLVTRYSQRLKYEIRNNSGSDAYLTVFRAYGIAIVESEPNPIKVDDLESQLVYGVCEYPNPDPWCTDYEDGLAMARYLVDATPQDSSGSSLGIMAYPRTRIEFKIMANVDHDHLIAAQAIDINQRIHINDLDSDGASVYGLYVDDDFIVDSLVHEVDNLGRFHTVTAQCTIAPTEEFRHTHTTYTPAIIIPDDEIASVPDDLYCTAMDPLGKMVVGIQAWKWNDTVTEGEIRAHFTTGAPTHVDMRTVAEGGTWVPNGTTKIEATGLNATKDGVNFIFDAYSTGRWYYVGRLRNNIGWSVWSDGNAAPSYVTSWVSTDSIIGSGSDAGPPDGSTPRAVMAAGGISVTASRPAINGGTILGGFAQIRDASQSAWYDVDETAGDSPAEVYYDGTGANHVYNKQAGVINSSGGFGTASAGDLILMDVRNNGSWSLDWCQWGTVPAGAIDGNALNDVPNFRPLGNPDVPEWQTYNKIRIKIVKPPWEWNTYGYIPSLAEFYYGKGSTFDPKLTNTFIFPVIPLPAAMAMGSVVARVFFENKICRKECGRTNVSVLIDTGNPAGAYGLEIITHATDGTIPDGMMKFRWYRDVLNYENIYCVAFWLNQATPPQGPYQSDRASLGFILETGECDITAEDPNVTVTRVADPTVQNMVLVIYTADATPDNDVDGEFISAEGTNSLTIHPFHKTGHFDYAIVKPWYYTGSEYTTNFAYYQFTVPDEVGNQMAALQWETPLMPCPSGLWYVVGASRNPFGLGTRLYADSATGGGGAMGCQLLTMVAGSSLTETEYEVYTIASETNVFYVPASGADFTLMNPTGNLYCGRPFCWIIKQPEDSTGPTEIFFDSMFRFCDEVPVVTLSVTPGCTDMIGGIYFSPWNVLKIVALVHNFQETP